MFLCLLLYRNVYSSSGCEFKNIIVSASQIHGRRQTIFFTFVSLKKRKRMKLNRKYIYIAITAAFFFYVIYESLSQPAAADLKGNFKELAFYRNEQNTGPIARVYAVSVSDTVWKEIETYGNYMPHNKYGNTKVYYFLDSKPMPQKLSADGELAEEYLQHCIARYEKGAMSQTALVKYPFAGK